MSETLTNILCHGGGHSKESNFVLRGKHCWPLPKSSPATGVALRCTEESLAGWKTWERSLLAWASWKAAWITSGGCIGLMRLMRTSPTRFVHIDIINQKRVMKANFEVGESLQVNHINENIIPSSTKHLKTCGYHDKHTEEPRDVWSLPTNKTTHMLQM